MSKLRIALDEYLKVRRSLGYKLLSTGNLLRGSSISLIGREPSSLPPNLH
jgi:hypothetical protein